MSRSGSNAYQNRPFSSGRSQSSTSTRAAMDRQQYPEVKQRGFYSDIIGADAGKSSLKVSKNECVCVCMNKFPSYIYYKYNFFLLIYYTLYFDIISGPFGGTSNSAKYTMGCCQRRTHTQW